MSVPLTAIAAISADEQSSPVARDWCVLRPRPKLSAIAKLLLGFVERLDDLALELAQPAAHTIIASPSRVFRGAEWAENGVKSRFSSRFAMRGKPKSSNGEIGYQENSMG
jgi:hypothetical protein